MARESNKAEISMTEAELDEIKTNPLKSISIVNIDGNDIDLDFDTYLFDDHNFQYRFVGAFPTLPRENWEDKFDVDEITEWEVRCDWYKDPNTMVEWVAKINIVPNEE